MLITPRAYKGMRDHLPEAMRLRRFITDTLIGVLERYGFEPLSTPIVEYSDTLEGKIGDEEKLLYRLKYGDDALTLRYDQTVPLARVVAQNEGKLTMPFKRYALGQSFRGERQARGRYREFWQLDADIVGVDSPIADAEIVAVVVEGLRAIGFTGAKVLLNHREILSGLARVAGVAENEAGGVYRAIDKLDKIGNDGVRNELLKSGVSAEAAERVLHFVGISGSVDAVLAEMESVLANDAPALAAVAALRTICDVLTSFGVPADSFTIAPSLARGLSYYTGCVFEAVLDSPPMGSLLGGGRYDNLVGMFSKRSLPTVGCAFGLERLFDLMLELNMGPRPERTIDAYVTLFASDFQNESLRLAGELRAAGLSVLTAYNPVKIANQFKEADRKGANFALVLGPDDLAAGVVQLKDLRTGEQQAVARDAIVAAIKSAL
ncbi:histidine--tRNA ligase [Herpetosiphon sp. NSE202]|uniref:histidine--tRNA ligase n=1 Tax=Herpetosiphon sp. NSE202 TaxID=3351349 RepID=UPI003631FEAE